MNHRISRVCAAALCGTALVVSGCSMFRGSVAEVNPNDAKMRDAKYDFSDLRKLAQEVSDTLLANPVLAKDTSKPILAPLGIQNRTLDHIDTQALEDTISTHMLDSQQVRFVNTKRRDDLLKEQGYQLANATVETRTAIGKQLGAKYMLTGSLVEISKQSGRQVRVSKEQDVYYQLTMEITDLETGLVAARIQKERMRTASKPLIGW